MGQLQSYFSGAQTNSPKHYYGWKRDKKDSRDLYHQFKLNHVHKSIKTVDMRDHCPTIYDQGALGSCSANAIAAAYEFDEMKQNEENVFTPSRLFIYYNERVMDGSVDEDDGAEIRDGIKSIHKIGVCPEKMWSYDIDKFADKPSEKCYEDAKLHHSVEYRRVRQNLGQMKHCLIEGFPVVFGFNVFESFDDDWSKIKEGGDGVMPIPKEGEKVDGGHAVVCCGFDDNKKAFIIRNSWGEDWCIDGYFYMPYEFMLNQEWCGDFWTIKRVKDDE